MEEVESKITEGMNESLTKVFTRTKVEETIKQMAPLKSPRPDGFRSMLLTESLDYHRRLGMCNNSFLSEWECF